MDDVVMGGVSYSSLQIRPAGNEPLAGVFEGLVTDDNNGGFTSIRTTPFDRPEDWSASAGVAIRVYGDGQRYKLILRTDPGWDTVCYCSSFDTVKSEWRTVKVPFKGFFPVFRAKRVSGPPFDPSKICSVQLMLSKFEYDKDLNPNWRAGRFELPFTRIGVYNE